MVDCCKLFVATGYVGMLFIPMCSVVCCMLCIAMGEVLLFIAMG